MKLQLIRNKCLLITLLWVCLEGLYAQSIGKYYVEMPDVLNPTLSKQNRMELLEYNKAGSGDSIVNRFGNMAYLLSIDTIGNHLIVKNTPTSTFEMQVMQMNDSTNYIGLIRTVCGPICHSSIEFYDTAWSQIPLQFTMPKAVDWINADSIAASDIDKKWVRGELETSFVTLNFAQRGMKVVAKNNSMEFLNEVDRKEISAFINNTVLTYKLLEKSWVRE